MKASAAKASRVIAKREVAPQSGRSRTKAASASHVVANREAKSNGGANAKAPTIPAAERKERKKRAPDLAPKTLTRLGQIHSDAHCELEHANPFQLIVATVLSAQTTDVAVNKVTPGLFRVYPTPEALAKAEPTEVEPLISTIGMYRQKSKNIVGLARAVVGEHHGQVPRTLAELVKLPGVGRKTANVVLGVAFGTPEGVVVDTHVQRITQRLGWTKNTDPPKIELDLCRLLPRNKWDPASHILIFHGRRICFAAKPNCAGCGVNDVCPSAFAAENVGRKPKRVRT